MSTLISIIVPCYNQALFLTDALESIRNQSYKNWECIIVNDGSIDDTETISKKYIEEDARFRYIFQKNNGLSSARNVGITAANGSYIQLLDADDLIEKNKISITIKRYQSVNYLEKKIIYSSMRYFDDQTPSLLKVLGNNDLLAHVELKQDDSIETQRQLIRRRNICVVSAPLFPKTVFDNIGNFDNELTALEDWDFNIRCITGGYKFDHQYDDQSRTLIRLHGSSMMTNQQLLDENYCKVLIKHGLSPRETANKNIYNTRSIISELTPPIINRLLKRLLSIIIFK